eukprot:6501152-Prymnesium_polylepis.1
METRLRAAGLSLHNVVSVQCVLVDLQELPAFNKAYLPGPNVWHATVVTATHLAGFSPAARRAMP